MTDEELITRAQAGDATAVVALYERYKQRIFHYLYYRLGDIQSAEDCTTEVFIRLIAHLSRFRLQAAPVRAWIFQIARNLATDQGRRLSKVQFVDLSEEMVDGSAAPDIVAERNLNIEQLRAALTQITDDQRDVILLRFIEGFSVAEVAQTLSKSESAVKNLQLRGLRTLQRVFRQPTSDVFG